MGRQPNFTLARYGPFPPFSFFEMTDPEGKVFHWPIVSSQGVTDVLEQHRRNLQSEMGADLIEPGLLTPALTDAVPAASPNPTEDSLVQCSTNGRPKMLAGGSKPKGRKDIPKFPDKIVE